MTVDVLNRQHAIGRWGLPEAERKGDGHRRQHMRHVVFVVVGLVPYRTPARSLDQLDDQPLLGVNASRLGEDQRSGAGNRNKADAQGGLLQGTAVRERLGSHPQREKLRYGRQGRGRANGLHESPPPHIGRKHGPHHSAFHGTAPKLLPGRLGRIVIALTFVLAAAASAAMKHCL